jgi:hypothetical protein
MVVLSRQTLNRNVYERDDETRATRNAFAEVYTTHATLDQGLAEIAYGCYVRRECIGSSRTGWHHPGKDNHAWVLRMRMRFGGCRYEYRTLCNSTPNFGRTLQSRVSHMADKRHLGRS